MRRGSEFGESLSGGIAKAPPMRSLFLRFGFLRKGWRVTYT